MPSKQWDPNNLSERMLNALTSMACSKDSLQGRLENAAITLMALRSDDFPAPVREEFEQIFEHLTSTKEQEDSQGKLHQTIANFGDDETSELIERIIYICHDTWKHLAS